MSRLPAAPLVALAAGLALGAGATWTLTHRAVLTSAPSRSVPANVASPSADLPATLTLPPGLAEDEADAALAAYLALPALPDKATPAEFSARLTRLRALLTLLPAPHFGKLFATLATRVGDAEARLRRAAFTVWTETDAPAAARWAAALVPGEAINANARQRYASASVLAWADSTFDDAYAWTTGLGDADLRRALAGELLGKLVATDPARALSLAQAGGEEFFAAARPALFRAWAAKDPAAAVQSLGAALLEKSDESWPVQEALAKWLKTSPRDAFAWIIAQPPRDASRHQSLLSSLSWQNARDPASARALADLLVAHPDIADSKEALRQLSDAWAGRDPRAARAWLAALPDAELRAKLVTQTAQQLKPADALAFIELLPAGPNRTDRIASQLERWALSAPDQALAWLDAHDSPEYAPALARVQGALIANLAKTDPAAALAKWGGLADGADKNAALGPLALAWSKTDPAAAARWLAPLLAGPEANTSDQFNARNTFNTVAARLARTDPQALMKLAAGLPDPSVRESLYNALTQDSHYDQIDHTQNYTTLGRSERVRLLASIPDEKLRTPVLQNALRDWLRKDFETASAWLESNDSLSPEQAAELISQTNPYTP